MPQPFSLFDLSHATDPHGNQRTDFFLTAAEIVFFFQFYSSWRKMKDQNLICFLLSEQIFKEIDDERIVVNTKVTKREGITGNKTT